MVQRLILKIIPNKLTNVSNKDMMLRLMLDMIPKLSVYGLGHDAPDYPVTWWWLAGRANYLWIHCKDITTLHQFSNATNGYNYFWHQEDDFTLTSKQYIWTYPGKPYTNRSVIVCPEWHGPEWNSLRVVDCYGICTDFVEKLK